MRQATELKGVWKASWLPRLKLIILVIPTVTAFALGLTVALNTQASEQSHGEPHSPDGIEDAHRITLDGLEKPEHDVASSYVITNLGDGPAETAHTYYTSDDAVVAVEFDPIPAPGGSKIYRLDEIASIPTGYDGYGVIDADQPITGAVLASPTPEPPVLVYLPLVIRVHGPTEPLSTGDSVRFHSWARGVPLEGIVTNSEFRSVLYPHYGDPVEAGGVFVVALMDVTNHGLESGEAGRYGFRVEDSFGRKFDIAGLDALFAAQDEYNRQGVYTAIQPGFTEQLVFVFDVLPESKDLHLVSSDPW